MALCMLGGPRIFPENEGEVDCIIAGRTDADHKAKSTPKRRQRAWASEKADERAKTGAMNDGADIAEHVAKDTLDTRREVYAAMRFAATFHDQAGELVDVKEINEEGKNKPTGPFYFREKEGRKHSMLRAVAGTKNFSTAQGAV